MTNRKTAKRAFLASVVALIICFSMLLGTTYAWFTDTVVAGRNRIVSGNLDIELDYAVMEDGVIKDWLPVKEDTNLFNENALYEPGYTEVVKFRVRNVGTLAAKCKLGINIVSETAGVNVYGDKFNLSDFLYTGVVDNAAVTAATRDQYAAFATTQFSKASDSVYAGAAENMLTLLPNDYVVGSGKDEAVFEVVVTMPTSVGNEANFLTDLKGDISDEGEEGFTNQPEIIFGVKLAATQWTYESDDFGIDYDEKAEFPSYSEAQLKADLSVPNSTTILTENVWVTEPIELAPGATLDGNGHVIYSSVGLNANGNSQFAIVATEGTIKNLAIVGSGRGVGTYGGLTGDLTLDNYYAAGGSYYFNIGNGNGHNFTVKNSTLSGWGSFGGKYDVVLFENCKFERGENNATVRAYYSATFRACDFEAGFNLDVADDLDYYVAIKLRGCTYNGNNANASEIINSREEALALGLIEQADYDAYSWPIKPDPNA